MQAGLGSVRAKETLAALRAKIASGDWPINEKIPPEAELTAMLGVGRTTVREAVRSLATLGMLETLPGIGTFVRSRTPVSGLLSEWISEFDLVEILAYRRALEVEAAQLAAVHRTEADLDAMRTALERDRGVDMDLPPERTERPGLRSSRTPGEFHTLVFEATKNRLMDSLYVGTLAALRAAMRQGALTYASGNEERRQHHAEIYAAIEAGDPVAAAHAMAAHTAREFVVLEGRA